MSTEAITAIVLSSLSLIGFVWMTWQYGRAKGRAEVEKKAVDEANKARGEYEKRLKELDKDFKQWIPDDLFESDPDGDELRRNRAENSSASKAGSSGKPYRSPYYPASLPRRFKKD